MTMTPERFHELLDAGTADAPPAPPVAIDLAAGRTRLRRRRTTAGAGAALAWSWPPAESGWVCVVETTAPSSRSARRSGPYDSCLATLPKAFFPDARVMSVAQSEHDMLILVESSEHPYWGLCETPPGRRLGRGGRVDVQLGASLHRRPGSGGRCRVPQTQWAATHGPSRSRTGWTRLLPRWRCSRGTASTERGATREGYYAFAVAAPLPDGVSFTAGGQLQGGGYDHRFPMVVRVTYMDSDGRPIAASVLDGTGTGPEQNQVEGLPLTEDAYPSLAGGL